MASVSCEIQQVMSHQLDRLKSLMSLFGRVFDESATYVDRQPDDDYLRSLLDSDIFIALVAVKEGQIIGGLAADELKKFEQARSEIYIYDLAVDEDHRRQGIATALIEKLRAIAEEQGAWPFSCSQISVRKTRQPSLCIPDWEFAKTSCILIFRWRKGIPPVRDKQRFLTQRFR